MEFTPPNAPLVVLAFLGLGAILASAALVFLGAAVLRKISWLPWIGGFAVLVVVLYAGVLLADSALSRERTLDRGEKKYFCEIDCHLAYSVEDVEVSDTLGPPDHEVRASGRWHVVRLKTWFDPGTISPRRGDSPLTPNPRVAYVGDAAGHRYERAQNAEDALAAMGRSSTPLTRPLRPGESYETLLAFDVPSNAHGLRLYVGDDDPIAFVLIGHEQSPFHSKVWFRI